LIRTWVRPSSCSTRWAAATIEFAVGDVGRDGDRAVAEVMGQRLDAVGAAGQQRDAVAVVHQRAVDHNRRASGRLRQRRPGVSARLGRGGRLNR
jgi:hypothetical protein